MRQGLAMALLLVLTIGPVAPAYAHKGHERNEAVEAPATRPENVAATSPALVTQPRQTAEEPPLPTLERLLDWLGRLHPMIVHFPLAFLPAALFTAMVARRRPGFDEPTRFLIVAGGLTAPLAAMLGWFDGGWRLWDEDQILAVHRWLGTGLGLGGLALVIWTLSRPDRVRGNGMLTALAAVTLAIIVQGWHGGALIHGADHLAW